MSHFENALKASKAAIQQLQNCVKNYKKTGKEKRTISNYKNRLVNLQKCFDYCFDRHLIARETASDADMENSYFVEDVFEHIEDLFIDVRSEIEDHIYKIESASTSSVPYHNVPKLEPSRPSTNSVHLPPIPLPKFNGKYSNWSSFHDLFVTLIHTNKSLDPVQKLHYLKTNLEGDAANLLKHYQITASNYESAWLFLKKRFQNKRILVNHQLKQLLNQPNAQESEYGIRRLLDTTTESVQALRNLEIDVSTWDSILVYIVTQKLPGETHQMWEQSLNVSTDVPAYDDLIKFLENRFRTLEMIGNKPRSQPTTLAQSFNERRTTSTQPIRSFQTNVKNVACLICKDEHATHLCQSFTSLSHDKKIEIIRQKGLCFNCLHPNHRSENCPSKKRCFECHQRHHSLLHIKSLESNPTVSVNHINVPAIASTSTSTLNGLSLSSKSTLHQNAKEFVSMFVNQLNTSKQILLATAIVKIISPSGNVLMLRALLDQGSQANFITESAVQTLQLERKHINARIYGIGNSNNCLSHGMVSFNLIERDLSSQLSLDALVLRNLTQIAPGKHINVGDWRHLENIDLADPEYFKPGKIDLLLGAQVYAQIIQDGVVKGAAGSPIAQRTSLGWILSGEIVLTEPKECVQLVSLYSHTNLDESLKRFWQIEDIDAPPISQENTECEKFYSTTTLRNDDGRYTVRLPFKNGAVRTFGRSRHIAVAQLLQLEKQFIKNPTLQLDYSQCINEYLTLGHMKPVEIPEYDSITQSPGDTPQYMCNYLPHHAVFKESSTTKTRVVFNASNKNADGISLNDKLLIGPKIQNNLIAVILQWRKYKFAFTADLHKMYRQINVPPEDANLQRIVWRNSRNEHIKDYQLQTVTFGTACAPFLAIRTLRQLAIDEGINNPLAKDAILNEFYVDDLLSGADDIEGALEKQRQLIHIMEAGKFELRKWSSNHPRLLSNIRPEHIEMNPSVDLKDDNTIKALGIHWHPHTDTFNFILKFKSDTSAPTKRKVVSDVAKLFDPVGWIAPVVISAKILIQQLWQSGIGWDDKLPADLLKIWTEYISNLVDIETIQIPRWISTSMLGSSTVSLHGFCDASQRAYAAVVYLKVEVAGVATTSILAAKTKVAPLKPVTLPRLELCGAVLLIKLIKFVIETLKLSNFSTHTWCDSQIVLAWLRGEPHRWATFVSNRVSQIQTSINTTWHYIPTGDNPADCATRGISPKQLQQHELWWHGPKWLCLGQETWPRSTEPTSTDVDKRITSLVCYTDTTDRVILLNKFSNLDKLTRITAYCFRFITNCKKPNSERNRTCLTAQELQGALTFWVKTCQRQDFSAELRSLEQNIEPSTKSKILSLTPFIDENGILRVGGRLQKSTLAFHQKHPMLLDGKSYLSKLIIREAHDRTLHGGPQLMIIYIRQRFWISNLRNIVRYHIHKCVICHRQKAEFAHQLMGNLPMERITASKTFYHTGVDYCGPFEIKASLIPRNKQIVKCYLAIFVCMATRAAHLELVENLSSDAFIAAFKRFVARRGYIGHINLHSDNGTNFVGAENQLRKEIKRCQDDPQVANYFAMSGITWHFIPPKAPTFGGLWEAAVKSTKHHLKRIMNNTRLNPIEFNTVITQIESCLNSRPLCPLNNDPNDITVLTPGHFLTGDVLLAIPEPAVFDTKIHRLNRWQFLQKLVQTFWKNWSSNYLHQLQHRPKWASKKKNVEIGNIVIIKEDNIPPNRWALGRVIEVHPGTDNLVRVVTLRTKTNTIKRPIGKICLLPIDDNFDN